MTKGNYVAELLSAVNRTNEFNLSCPGSDDFRMTSLAASPLRSDLEIFVASIQVPPDFRVNNCAGIHFGALVQITGTPQLQVPVITIGNIEVQGNQSYGVSDSSLRELLQRGPTADSPIDLHVWLTFPDATILDLTLGLLLRRDHPEAVVPLLNDRITIYTPAEDLLPFLRYRPQLVGEEFLFRVGALHDGSRQMLREVRATRRG